MASNAYIDIIGRSERLDTQSLLGENFRQTRSFNQLRHEVVTYNQANGTVYTLEPVGSDRLLYIQILKSTGVNVEIAWTGDSPCTAVLPAGRVMLMPTIADGTTFTITIGTSATIEFLTLGA